MKIQIDRWQGILRSLRQARLFVLFLFAITIGAQAAIAAKPPIAHPSAVALLPPPGAGQVWSLEQNSILLGDFDVQISKCGLRAFCRRSGITFVARPPLWQPVCFSSRSQSIWYATTAQFNPADTLMKSMTVFGGVPIVSNIPLRKRGRKIVHGLDCVDMSTDAKYAAAQLEQCRQGSISKLHARTAEYQGAQLPLPAGALTVLTRIYGVPAGNTLPVFFCYINFNHSVKLVLMTNKCSVVTPGKDWLKVPTNFKKVNSFQELQMDPGAKLGVENLF